jgi:c-di-AMP phosphodiesterase-like protein
LVRLIDKKVSTKSVVKSVVGGAFIALMIIAPVVLITINMFIYTKLMAFLSIFLFTLTLVWSLLYYGFYYKLLKNYHPEIKDINTKIPQYVETSFMMLFFSVLGIIILSQIL